MIHAGNASQISDGASAVLIMTAGTGRRAGSDPDRALPQRRRRRRRPAADAHRRRSRPRRRCSSAPGWRSPTSARSRSTRRSRPCRWRGWPSSGADQARLNPLGGAIAVGHPLGASRHAADDAHAAPHARQGHPLRPADDVRGRRHGERDDRRAGGLRPRLRVLLARGADCCRAASAPRPWRACGAGQLAHECVVTPRVLSRPIGPCASRYASCGGWARGGSGCGSGRCAFRLIPRSRVSSAGVRIAAALLPLLGPGGPAVRVSLPTKIVVTLIWWSPLVVPSPSFALVLPGHGHHLEVESNV